MEEPQQTEQSQEVQSAPDPVAELREQMGAAIAELHKKLDGLNAVKNEIIGVRDLLTKRAEPPTEEVKPQPPRWAQKPQENPNR